MLLGREKVQVLKLNYPCYFYTSKWKLEPLCYWYAVSIFLLLRSFIFFLPKRKQILDLHAFKVISTLRCQACSVKSDLSNNYTPPIISVEASTCL